MEELEAIKARMQRQGLDEALNHLSLAEGALNRCEWEAANSQVRACLESLFEGVARIKLGCSKTRGAARKELELSGVLREPEARLVQSFFGVASGGGSHAGRSNEEEAQGRFLAGLGICMLGLALMPKLVRVEDALADDFEHPSPETLADAWDEGYNLSPGEPLETSMYFGTDAEFYTTCPSCQDEQALTECEVKREGDYTAYWCRNGCQKLVLVGPRQEPVDMNLETPHGRYVVRNVGELRVPAYDKATNQHLGTLTFFALRRALVKRLRDQT
jgi:hypothetical protein